MSGRTIFPTSFPYSSGERSGRKVWFFIPDLAAEKRAGRGFGGGSVRKVPKPICSS